MGNKEMVTLEIFKALVSFHSDNAKSMNTQDLMADSIDLAEQLLGTKIK